MSERCACTHKKVDHHRHGCGGIVGTGKGPKPCPCSGFTEHALLTREDLARAWDEGYVAAYCKWSSPPSDSDFPAAQRRREKNARSRAENPYTAEAVTEP